mmetsp:Transcript_108168/g.337153  ORF Transcript_108168/g.337153 Transcript_108168/m.337153 type:complete len:175 (+) Transcript_108168:116-640(+)
MAAEETLPVGAGGGEYELRQLRLEDHQKGYAPLLAQLTDVGDLTEARFAEVFSFRQRLAEVYRTLVVEHIASQRIVATGTLVIEAKFVHGGSQVGHVEDIVVDEDHRKKGLARELMEGLAEAARVAGCYKVILDCKPENAPFYERCGYRRCECQMRLDIPSDVLSPTRSRAPEP